MDLRRRIERQLPALPARDGAAEPLVIGVSGGLDSMVLLHVLAGIAREGRLTLHVAHCHHGLRGADADADARLVEETARSLGAGFTLGQLDPGERRRRQAASTESTEMWARRRRHAFLADVARAVGARWIALGHHLDDQAELFVLRLLRGAGSEGLGGMRALAPSPADPDLCLIRPLLSIRRTELEAYARQTGLAWRHDASNDDPAIPRNRVRHEILPALMAMAGPALPEILARTAELAAAEAEFIRAEARRWQSGSGPAFAELPPALQRAVVHEQLLELGQEPTFALVERLRQAAGTTQSAPGARQWQRDENGRIQPAPPQPGRFRATGQSAQLTGRSGRILVPPDGPGVAWRRIARRAGTVTVRPPAGREWLDADRVGSQVVLRHWRPGDRFQPLGFPAPSKLQDLFTARKVPPSERRERLLLAAADGTLCWVEGLPPGEACKIRPETTRILEIRPTRSRPSRKFPRQN